MFLTEEIIKQCSWQAFERLVCRLLVHKGYKSVRIVGGPDDKGADVIALDSNKNRWLFQAKHWKKSVPESEMQKTLEAASKYRASRAVVVALNGVDDRARAFQKSALLQGQSLTVWTPTELLRIAASISPVPFQRSAQGEYQEVAIGALHGMLLSGSPRKGMLVMATGLGKTFTAAEAICRVRASKSKYRTLVIAHTNPLILQLEKAFWTLIGPQATTLIWNQYEKPDYDQLATCDFVFASRDSVSNFVQAGNDIPNFDLILIDECHHANSQSTSYNAIINGFKAGSAQGPQLVGLTATPFLADPSASLHSNFGSPPLVNIDMIYGLKHGFLSQVDYRLFTDNINWEALSNLRKTKLSPKSVNRSFFIKEWDDGVVRQLQKTWSEVSSPKAIVFCGTIDHALTMRDKINSLGFCKAEAIHSGSRNENMTIHQRNLVLSSFEAGDINVICTVDVFNEGIDVPDVNIVVFNRVTHSRRIFIQQLGRGLRITPGKDKAIVLDFAQDIRRYAAGISMKDQLAVPAGGSTLSIGNRVEFRNATGADPKAESFLRAWLKDVEAIEAAGDDQAGVLKFPPQLS